MDESVQRSRITELGKCPFMYTGAIPDYCSPDCKLYIREEGKQLGQCAFYVIPYEIARFNQYWSRIFDD